MLSQHLYQWLETSFRLDLCHDDWPKLRDHPAVCDQFKKRSMGLILDFCQDTQRAATAVFPSPHALDHLREIQFSDGLLLCHHPMHWNLRDPNVWSFPNQQDLDFLRNQRISLYALHTPLDRDGPCATSGTFASALGVTVDATFDPYYGHDAGVIGPSPTDNLDQLSKIVASAVGHNVTTHPYCTRPIQRVGVVGGGISLASIEQAKTLGLQAIVTGISVINSHSAAAHEAARRHNIAWIGVSHYSSERFACEALATNLRRLGLPASFVPDNPDSADMA